VHISESSHVSIYWKYKFTVYRTG